MTSAMFTAHVESISGLQAGLAAIVPGIARPLALMRGIDGIRRRQIQRTFRAQTDAETGAPWAKAAPFTLGLRPSGGGRTLSATGALLNSITGRAPEVTEVSVTHGTHLPYGPSHQLGLTIKPRGKFLAIPATREAVKFASGRQHWVKAWFAANPSGVWFFAGGSVWGFGLPAKTKGGDPIVHGYLKREVKLPRRRFLGLSDKDREEIETYAAGWLEAQIVAAVRRANQQGGQP